MLLRKIAKRIKQVREAKGMTQEQVFHELEIHIARIETAKHNISVSTLSKICEYFDITLADFFKKLD
ncbi:MAG: XRE family transcriptional regulator [Pedobacter sp.]|nr:MAG: XRE family transcriptional regulator [Pedobacter sp.]